MEGDRPDRHGISGAEPAAWWNGSGLERYLGDLLWAEIGRLRPGRAATVPDWGPGVPLGEEGLGLDSLERLRAVAAVEQALGLPPGDGSDRLLAAATFGELAAGVRRLLPGPTEP